MLCVLSAFGFTTSANVETNRRKLGNGGGALRGQRDHRAANRKHFVHGLGAGTHRFIAGCQHIEAMAQAHLPFADAIAGRGNQRFVSNPG
jgi:hypothetical protein